MAVASAGTYASLHLAPDRQPYQHPTTQSFTGRMPFLPPNQQRQSTEGKSLSVNAADTVRVSVKSEGWGMGGMDSTAVEGRVQ